MLECISGAIDTRALAVPHGKYPVRGALGICFNALRTEHCGSTQFFVDGGQKVDAAVGQPGLCLPDLLVDHTKRRATVTTDKTLGIPAARLVKRALHRQQSHQRLGAGDKNLALAGPQIIGNLVFAANRVGHERRLLSKRPIYSKGEE